MHWPPVHHGCRLPDVRWSRKSNRWVLHQAHQSHYSHDMAFTKEKSDQASKIVFKNLLDQGSRDILIETDGQYHINWNSRASLLSNKNDQMETIGTWDNPATELNCLDPGWNVISCMYHCVYRKCFHVLSQNRILEAETALLETLKFDLEIEHPYMYLLKFAKLLKGFYTIERLGSQRYL